jgi:methylamine dehydrogenase light chain
MSWLDNWMTRRTRRVARNTSRRAFVGRLGAALVGGAAIPLLPVARAAESQSGESPRAPQPQEKGNPLDCSYWRFCALDGYLCGCCGGSANSCPPGTEPSPVTWIGTCRNPVDGRDYIISYNDCCGKTACGHCLCQRNEGDRPVYQPAKSNDINWCHGTKTNIYHCSTSVVLGVAVAD